MAAKLDENAKGVYVISATPFTDTGALDLESTDRMVDFYHQHGVHGATILGIMGEAPKLTMEESLAFVKRFIGRAKGKPVIVGVSNPGIDNMRKLAHESMALGACGVMIAPIPSIKSDEQLVNYYAQACAALGADVPVCFQDYPQLTGVYMSVPAFHRIVDEQKQVVMLKHEDAPGLGKITRIRDEASKAGRRRVSILVGNGGLYIPQELQRGVDGIMTGFAWPEMLVQVYELHASGQVDAAEDLFDIYLPLVKHEQQPGMGLALRKEALWKRGAIASPKQRAPGGGLTAVDKAELERLTKRMERRLADSGRSMARAAE